MGYLYFGIISLLVGFSVGFITCHKRGSGYEVIRSLREKVVSSSPVFDDEKAEILIVGDSLAKRGDWRVLQREYTTVNFGVGGARVRDLNELLSQLIINEKRVATVLLIGTNDIGDQRSILGVADSILRVTGQSSFFSEQVFLVSIPLMQGPGSFDRRPSIRALNSQFENRCSKLDRVHYIDWNKLLDPSDEGLDKEWATDALHLKQKAYEPLSNYIKNYLKR